MQTANTELQTVADYLAAAPGRELPENVRERAKLHILDTVAAIVSGSRLAGGVRGRAWAAAYGQLQGGTPATIVGSNQPGSAFVAALCNGMSAHADETDDSHPESLSHPGCAVVPAALAAAETAGASGELLLRSVTAGYDIGCRVGRTVGLLRHDVRIGSRSSHSMVGGFGAVAAAAVAFGFNEQQVRHAISYGSQLSSGITTWMRDTHHVEKAFVFAGMPASQGLLATTLVRSGCDGVEDVFSGRPNWLEAVAKQPEPEWMVWELGREYEITRTTLKKYSVGSPAQAAVEAMLELVREAGLRAEEVLKIEIRLPADSYFIVDSREMPSINCQYLVVGTLQDSRFSFEMAHDEARMTRPDVRDLLGRTTLIPDEGIRGTRGAHLAVTRRVDGGEEVLNRTVTHVRGTAALPMSVAEVTEKALDLIAPVIGAEKGQALCDRILDLESVGGVGELMQLMNG